MIIDKDRRIAEEPKRQLLTHHGERIRRVILYRSRAQGRATEDSDFDFLVVEKDPVSKARRCGVFVKPSAVWTIRLTSG